MGWPNFNSFQPSVTFHIENSHLIFIANPMTGFYMKCNTGLKWFNQNHVIVIPPKNFDPLKLKMNYYEDNAQK